MKKPRFTPLQIIVHLAGWIPLAVLVFNLFTHNLTANPIQAIEKRTGFTAITFLVLSLACTPLAFLGWKELTQRRKALGNYGFMYAAIHVTIFVAVDYGLNLNAILRDVGKKPYIIIGATAFLLLLPLAVTSFNYWMKRLGKNWKRLHKLVYFISPLVVIHFFMARKGDFLNLKGDVFQPLLYAVVIGIFLLLRLAPVKTAWMRLRTRFLAPAKGT